MYFCRDVRMLVILLLLFGLLIAPASAVQKGKDYGNLSFPAVLSEHDQKYLGLSSTGAFNLENIGAPYVVLEVMRTSCPHCLEQVPGMNSFFNLAQNSDLKGKVRFLAVAQGCSADEAKNFKKRHKVAFPVLADPKGDGGGCLRYFRSANHCDNEPKRPGPPGACGGHRQPQKGFGRIAGAC